MRFSKKPEQPGDALEVGQLVTMKVKREAGIPHHPSLHAVVKGDEDDLDEGDGDDDKTHLIPPSANQH